MVPGSIPSGTAQSTDITARRQTNRIVPDTGGARRSVASTGAKGRKVQSRERSKGVWPMDQPLPCLVGSVEYKRARHSWGDSHGMGGMGEESSPAAGEWGCKEWPLVCNTGNRPPIQRAGGEAPWGTAWGLW
eukprot:GGOE01028239.1.p3 GENE.GGOE01028239.1~~GGOE01028239.1.p3  ORF type:complete len:132 (+),score=1.07 GGOE01028239.1:108-503(+)